MDTWIWITFTLALYYVIWLFVKNRNLPPGPYGYPIIGYLPHIDSIKPYVTFQELSEKYGSIYSVQLGNTLAVVAADVEVIRKALSQDVFTGRADLYLTHGIMKGYGIICAEGERWKTQRRFLISSLKDLGIVKYGARREKFHQMVMKGVEQLLQKIEMHANEEYCVVDGLMHCVGNVMNQVVFGRTWNEDDPMWMKLRHLAEEGVKYIGVAGVINFFPILRFLPSYRQTMRFIMDGKEETHKYYRQVIDCHKEEETDDLIVAYLRMMQCDSSFTWTQFYHFLADAFGAGLDTTVTTLTWMLLLLSQHVDIQERIQNDLDKCDKDRIGLEDISTLVYLEACIAETERIRPVTPIGIPHSPLKDTILNGFRIPKGSMFVPLIWAVHMNPMYWTDPHVFNPDRFIKDGHFYKPKHFIPFQTGKRVCVGQEMSRIMLLLFSSNLLKHYSVMPLEPNNPPEDILEGICGITFVPKHNSFIFKARALS